MVQFATPATTATSSIAITKRYDKITGVVTCVPDLETFNAQVVAESGNISPGDYRLAIWEQGRLIRVSTEPEGFYRKWDREAATPNALTVVLPNTKTITLAATTNTIMTDSGTPSGGEDGDYSWNPDTSTLSGPKATTWPSGVILFGDISAAISAHTIASDPHGDRDYADGLLATITDPVLKYQHVDGASEINGTGGFRALPIIGLQGRTNSLIEFDTIHYPSAVTSASLGKTIEWRVYVSSVNYQNLANDPADSGSFTYEEYNKSEAAGAYQIINLNKILTAQINEYILVFVKLNDGATGSLSVRLWTNSNPTGNRVAGLYGVSTTWTGTSGLMDVAGGTKYWGASFELYKKPSFSANNVSAIADHELVGTTVESQLYELADNKNPRLTPQIVLPSTMRAVVGYIKQIYPRGIIAVPSENNIFANNITCDVGNLNGPLEHNYYEITPSAGNSGTHTFTVSVEDLDRTVVSTASSSLVITNPTGQPASNKNILCLGDSTGGGWVAEFYRLLTGSGGTPVGLGYSNITMLGNRKSGSAKWVNYGGWTVNSYLSGSNSTSAYLCTVDSHTKTVADLGSFFDDANGNRYYLDEIRSTTILKMYLYTGTAGNMPTSGTLTYVSGGSDTGNIVFTATANTPASPLWNGSAVSFSHLVDKVGGSGLDVCYVGLAINTYFGMTNTYYDYRDFTSFLANMDSLYTVFHADYPSAIMAVLGCATPSPHGGMGYNYGAVTNAQYFKQLRASLAINSALQYWCSTSPQSSYCEFVGIAPCFDADNNYPNTTKAVNAWNVTTEKVQTNGVHPDTTGYLQIAGNVVLPHFIAKFCSS